MFYDRLVDDKDRSWFLAYLRTVMKEKLGADFDKLFAHLRQEGAASQEVNIEDVRKCFFGDYMDPNGEAARAGNYARRVGTVTTGGGCRASAACASDPILLFGTSLFGPVLRNSVCLTIGGPASHAPLADEPMLRLYDEVMDVAALLSRVEELLMDHNATSKRPMNLAVFLYAVEHVSRIARVLKQPGVC